LSEVADVPISEKSTEAIMAGSGRSSNFIVEIIRRPMREDEHLGFVHFIGDPYGEGTLEKN
jgi:hypothetical protein